MMSQKNKVFIVDGKRTAFAKFGGSFKYLSPVDLAVLSAQGLVSNKIDHVIFSNVIPSTPDTLYGGRHLALKLGLDEAIPAYNINRLCGSGIEAIVQATRLIRSGEAKMVLTSGAENLSLSPHLTYGARFGTKYGALKSKDLLWDTLTDQYINTPMGMTAEALAQKQAITRQESDEYSLNSHLKAIKAYQEGLIQDELVEHPKCSRDEHLREDIKLEELSKLKPTFSEKGVVTAGSASGIVDGAASLLIASEEMVNELKLTPLAEIIDWHVCGVDPRLMGMGPVPAISNLLQKNSLELEQIDFFEINEAFAPQVMYCQQILKIPEEKLNVWGGAVALGHPLGATGLKISLTLSRQLRHYNKKLGIASACIGGGQGIALLIKGL
ncbi:MAG TPA: thiolase family protein [Bacteriovoracaceae bacterium]|nr:thiolase family protein [Bacteriovoracaceae bacterium]